MENNMEYEIAIGIMWVVLRVVLGLGCWLLGFSVLDLGLGGIVRQEFPGLGN